MRAYHEEKSNDEIFVRNTNSLGQVPDHSVGYFKLFDQMIEETSKNLEQAQTDLQQAQTNQALVQEMEINIGKSYHPYDLKTGIIQTEEQVSSQIKHCFEQIN